MGSVYGQFRSFRKHSNLELELYERHCISDLKDLLRKLENCLALENDKEHTLWNKARRWV